MQKKISIALYSIIIALILFLSGNLIYSFAKGQPPRILGYEFFTVTSGSMEPSIKTGTLIFVKETQPEELKVGDIITFKDSAEKTITTHRITEVIKENKDLKFKTKGDANESEDTGLIPSYAILGKVADFKIAYLGTIFLFLKTSQGILVAFGLTIVIATIVELLTKRKKVSIEESKKPSNCYIIDENGELIIKK